MTTSTNRGFGRHLAADASIAGFGAGAGVLRSRRVEALSDSYEAQEKSSAVKRAEVPHAAPVPRARVRGVAIATRE